MSRSKKVSEHHTSSSLRTPARATSLFLCWIAATPVYAQMVLVMESDGSLIASQIQNSFARNYNDGVGQGSAADALAIFDEPDTAAAEETRIAAIAPRAPLPRADVLAAIEATALRYGSHPGLRRTRLSVSDWLTLFRANIEIESAYRQSAVSSAGAIGLGQLMPATARNLNVDPRDPLQNLDGSARYLAMMLLEFGDPRLALAAYNAGPDAVRQYNGIPLIEKPKIMWPASWRWSPVWKEQTHELPIFLEIKNENVHLQCHESAKRGGALEIQIFPNKLDYIPIHRILGAVPVGR